MALTPAADLYAALNAFQAELVTVAKTSENPFFKSSYAGLADIMKAAQPVLTRHGLAVVQLPSHVNGAPSLRTIVAHTSGQSVEDNAPLALSKNDPQSQGSAITYLRRYAYAAALGIVIDEDDDGNTATRSQRVTPASTHSDEPQVRAVSSGHVSTAMVTRIQIRMRELGLTDRDAILAEISRMIGREVTSSKELTAQEGHDLLAALETRKPK